MSPMAMRSPTPPVNSSSSTHAYNSGSAPTTTIAPVSANAHIHPSGTPNTIVAHANAPPPPPHYQLQHQHAGREAYGGYPFRGGQLNHNIGGDDEEEEEVDDHHQMLLDSLSDVHEHDELYHHYAELLHASGGGASGGGASGGGNPTTISNTLTEGGGEHSPQQDQQQQQPLGATLRALMDAQHGTSEKEYRRMQDQLLEKVHQVMDQTLEMASLQGNHGSERHQELEVLISKATLRMALATLAERHRDDLHLKGGGLEGQKSKFDDKPMWSLLQAPRLHLTDRFYHWYHQSFFRPYRTARNLQSPEEFRQVVDTGVTQAYLLQALYDEHQGVNTMLTTLHQTRIVAHSRSDNVRWLISEGSRYKSEFCDIHAGEAVNQEDRDHHQHHQQHEEVPVLSLTIRGYVPGEHAPQHEQQQQQGEGAHPDQLLVDAAYAQPTPLNNHVMVHSGLYKVAQSIYHDVKPYLVDQKPPNSKIVIAGHSLGGSLGVLVLLLLTMDQGPEWTQQNVLRVYTYGAIPVLRYTGVEYPRVDHDNFTHGFHSSEDSEFVCPVLAYMGLPPSMVYGYVQPWDPMPRLFSEVDPFHHAFDDVGKDGVSLLASGPSDFRRPMRHYWATKAQDWPLWNAFRDNIRAYGHEQYRSVGIAHLLLPGQRRYMTDVFAHIDLHYPQIYSVVRVDGTELLSLLFDHFPMDSYALMRTSVAMRSFWHHLMPSYAIQFQYFQEWGSSHYYDEGHMPKSPWLP